MSRTHSLTPGLACSTIFRRYRLSLRFATLESDNEAISDGYRSKDIRLYLLLLCQMRDINNMSGGNVLVLKKCNSVPYIVRNSRQRSCNQRVGCLQYWKSRASGPVKRSGPRLLSTVPRGINRIINHSHKVPWKK